jgi:hypothetical protein
VGHQRPVSGRWRANCAIDCYDKVLIGDAFSGKIGYLSATTYTSSERTTQALCTSPPIHADRKRCLSRALSWTSRLVLASRAGRAQTRNGCCARPRMAGEPIRPCRSGGRPARIGAIPDQAALVEDGAGQGARVRIDHSDPVKRTIIAANGDGYIGG